jgi:iron uptake system component EfeO
MPCISRTSQVLLLGTVSAAIVLTGCASAKSQDEAGGAGATVVEVVLTNDDCKASPAEVKAGAVKFDIKNSGGSAVSEAELMQGSKILGEKEGLTPGLTGSFSLKLEPGSYEMYCPHAKTERSPFTVTGGASGNAAASASSTEAGAVLLAKAAVDYRVYAEQRATELIGLTEQFVTAVKAGDVAKAQGLYAKARAPYEAIEPVAESFGDLDPEIDAREGDGPAAAWRGFHRIEKQLWIAKNTTGMGPVADKLLVDVKALLAKIKTTSFQPAQLANGATELLNEVSKSKLTGEEERYSRTDLADVDANVEGSKAAYELLAPALNQLDNHLAETIESKFGDVHLLLEKYEISEGEFKPYTELTAAQVKELTTAVDALAEPLSKVGEQIVTVK